MRRVRESFPFSVESSDIQPPRITLACVASRFESPSCNARKHLANALRISAFSLLIAWLSPISAWAQADNGATGEETPTTEVVVTAARTTLPANALPLTVDVIDSKSLAQQAALSGSVIDAVSTLVPSFSPTRQKLSGYGESLRGRSPRWDSKWDRVELWLFDLHHYLLAGQTGSTVAGVLALIGIGFVATGTILWWPLRKTFRFRSWPARMSRPAIVRQHRDLGIVIAPLLFLSLLTGAMMTLRPVAMLLLSPWSSPAAMETASAKPDAKSGPLADRPDWLSMLTQARRLFPTAEFRLLALPGKPGDLISLRMKQPQEWLPNGRTMLWFAPEDGRLVEARDALTLPTGLRINNSIYPLHAAKVGGLPYRLVMTASGLSLATLGSLSVWAFWFRRKPLPYSGYVGNPISCDLPASKIKNLQASTRCKPRPLVCITCD